MFLLEMDWPWILSGCAAIIIGINLEYWTSKIWNKLFKN